MREQDRDEPPAAQAMETQIDEFFKRRDEGRYPILTMDGLALGKMAIVAAMEIDSEGRKRIWDLIGGGL